LATQIERYFGDRLLALYLHGSLTTGAFVPGGSDLDLLAVLDAAVAEGADIATLAALHERFEAERPAWRDRIEVLYVSRAVLATLSGAPVGTVARVSPGELTHLRELDGEVGWLLDWYAALHGETLFGPPPADVGPPVSPDRFREAVVSQLRAMAQTARGHDVAYVPAQQGYIVATVCRAMYSLATGGQTSKETAVAWVANQRPDLADFLWEHYNAYRADVRGPHELLISFVDDALNEATAPRRAQL